MKIRNHTPTTPRRGVLWHSLLLCFALLTFVVAALLLFGPLVWPTG